VPQVTAIRSVHDPLATAETAAVEAAPAAAVPEPTAAGDARVVLAATSADSAGSEPSAMAAVPAPAEPAAPPPTAIVVPFYRDRSYLARAASIALAAAIGALVGSLSPLAIAPAAEPVKTTAPQADVVATAASVDTLAAEVKTLKAALATRSLSPADAAAPAPAAAFDKLAVEVASLKAALDARAAAPSSVPPMAANVDALARDVALLKASFGSSRSSADTHLTDLVAQVNRAEKAEADLAVRLARLEKPEVTNADDTPTGAILSATPPVAEGWVLWRVYNGRAVVQSQRGIFDVVPGVDLPGLGRVREITERNGRWVVITQNGTIIPAPGHHLG